MSEILINPARTCAFTGHRIMEKGFNIEELKDKISKLIGIGYDTFLVGMALGFDTLAFQTLEEFRTKNNIRIIACIPCLNQSYKFTSAQKKEYDRMLKVADERIFVGQEYDKTCMRKRNEFMVNNSSCLIAYVRRDFGGSVSTIKYAVKKGVMVISV